MSKSPGVRKPAGRYHHGDLRQALVQGGLELLREGGLEALSLRAAARRAGVSQTAPYSHFADKKTLLAGIAAQGYRLFAARMQREAAGLAGARQRTRALARGYVAFACEQPELFRLMFGPGALAGVKSEELQEAAAAAFAVLRQAVAKRIGSSRDAAARTAVGAIAAWSLVHGLAHLLIDGKITPQMINQPNRDALVDTIASRLTLV